jgi:hypothetical protein
MGSPNDIWRYLSRKQAHSVTLTKPPVFLAYYLNDPQYANQKYAASLLPLIGTLSSGIIYCSGMYFDLVGLPYLITIQDLLYILSSTVIPSSGRRCPGLESPSAGPACSEPATLARSRSVQVLQLVHCSNLCLG